MLNMIAGSVLPITAFIGVFFAFAATCILTSFLNDWLPRDMGREFAHNGKLSAGKPRGAGIIFISVFCIAALLFGEMSVEMFIYLVLVFVGLFQSLRFVLLMNLLPHIALLFLLLPFLI